jgi:hypothetical protein
MRSQLSFFGLLISSFVLVIAFQNCGSVSEMMPGGAKVINRDGNNDEVTCMAFPVPYLQLGFVFSNSAPSAVELTINGETAYSDCSVPGSAANLIRENSRLEFYRGYESINEVPTSLELSLYRLNCNTGARNLITTIQELEPNYESHSLCGKTSVRLVIDYMVNE